MILPLLAASALAADPEDYVWDIHGVSEERRVYQMALQMAQDNSRVYGAAGIMERKIIPGLSGLGRVEEGGGVVTLEYNSMYGLASLPYACPESYSSCSLRRPSC